MRAVSVPNSLASVLAGLIKSLSFLDRYLALWIVLAMVIGVVCGYFIKGLPQAFSVVDIQGTSLPIAFGLWFMMWPVLSKVVLCPPDTRSSTEMPPYPKLCMLCSST